MAWPPVTTPAKYRGKAGNPKLERDLSHGNDAAKVTEFNKLNTLGTSVYWKNGRDSGQGITISEAFLGRGSVAVVKVAGNAADRVGVDHVDGLWLVGR